MHVLGSPSVLRVRASRRDARTRNTSPSGKKVSKHNTFVPRRGRVRTWLPHWCGTGHICTCNPSLTFGAHVLGSPSVNPKGCAYAQHVPFGEEGEPSTCALKVLHVRAREGDEIFVRTEGEWRPLRGTKVLQISDLYATEGEPSTCAPLHVRARERRGNKSVVRTYKSSSKAPLWTCNTFGEG